MKLSTSPTVAVLGTGLIGAPVARNLAGKGFRVRAWNRTADKARALEQAAPQALTACASVAAAVRDAAYVLTVLKDGDSVKAVMEAGAGHFLPGARWIQLSTVGVEAADRLAGLAKELGLIYIDAPVQGSRQPAELGQLLILASGPLAERDAVQALFDAIGRRTVWVSELAGQGSRLKLALNNWAFTLTHGLAESLAIIQGLGMDPALFIEVLRNGPLDCAFVQNKGQVMLAGDYAPGFTVENAIKDSLLIMDAARQAGAAVDLARAGLQRFQRALEAGHGDKDMAASFLALQPRP